MVLNQWPTINNFNIYKWLFITFKLNSHPKNTKDVQQQTEYIFIFVSIYFCYNIEIPKVG